jgi:hypothetical protein
VLAMNIRHCSLIAIALVIAATAVALTFALFHGSFDRRFLAIA